MALVSNTLASGLASMAPVESEAAAISAFVSAWDSYFAGAGVLTATAVAGSYAAGLTAMNGAMGGLSTGAAAAIQAGIVAFWGAIATLGPTIWIPAPSVVSTPLVPPTTLSGIAAALTAQFSANVSAEADLATASSNVASILHANGGLGGFAPVITPPSPTPVPTPIL